MGFYRSMDNGTSFEKVGNPSIREVTSIHFSEEFSIIVANRLYSYEYTTGDSYVIHENVLDVFISGSDVYLLDTARREGKFEITMYKTRLVSASETLLTDETTRLFTTELQMNLEQPLVLSEVFFPHFFMVGENLLITVAVRFPGTGNLYDAHEVALINPASGVLEFITPTFIEGFTTATIEQDPKDEKHLLLGPEARRPTMTLA
jgi:hypothetical protein